MKASNRDTNEHNSMQAASFTPGCYWYAVRRDGKTGSWLLDMRASVRKGNWRPSRNKGPERFHFIQRQQHDAWSAGYQCSSCDSVTDATTKRSLGCSREWRNVHVPTCTHGKMHMINWEWSGKEIEEKTVPSSPHLSSTRRIIYRPPICSITGSRGTYGTRT